MVKVQVDDDVYDIEAILFDKDGTLLELDVLWSSWFDELWDEVNRNQSLTSTFKENIAHSIGLDLKTRMISAKGPLAIGTMEDIAVIMAFHLYSELIPWNEAVQLVRQSMRFVHENMNWEKLLQPIRQLIPFLSEAKEKGLKLAVITSDDTSLAKLHLQILKIDQYFHSIIGSDQIALPKPFPDIGLQACEEMKVSANKVIVIGDTDADMNLARNLQAKASIGIVNEDKENGNHLTEADHIINHYGQLVIV